MPPPHSGQAGSQELLAKCKFHGYHEAASTVANWNRRWTSPRLSGISYWEDDVSHPYVIAFPEQH
jgi:hypothetical protein